MIVRELITRLGFDADESKARRYDTALKTVRNTSLALVGAVTAASAAVFAFANSMAEAGNEVAKSAVEAGLAIDEFQELQFVIARISQVNSGEVTKSFAQAASVIQKAKVEGGRYADELKRIGFTHAQIKNGSITTSQIFDRIATSSQNAAKQADAVSAASIIFGDRVARRLLPALQRGDTDVAALRDRFKELGGGFSEEGAANSEIFVDSLFDLRTMLKSISINIAEKLIPIVTKVVVWFTDLIAKNRELIQQRLHSALDLIVGALFAFWTIGKKVWKVMDDFVKSFTTWEKILKVGALGLLVIQLAKFGAAILPIIKGIGLLGAAVFALKAALVIIAGLALDDIINWVQGNESALGRMIGSFESFKERLGFIYDWLKEETQILTDGMKYLWDSVIEKIKDFTNWASDMVPDWMKDMIGGKGTTAVFNQNTSSSSTQNSDPSKRSSSSTQNSDPLKRFLNRDPAVDVGRSMPSNQEIRNSITNNITLPVAKGTTSEQKEQLSNHVESIIQAYNDRQVVGATANFGSDE